VNGRIQLMRAVQGAWLLPYESVVRLTSGIGIRRVISTAGSDQMARPYVGPVAHVHVVSAEVETIKPQTETEILAGWDNPAGGLRS
jgi:hypothetical protein